MVLTGEQRWEVTRFLLVAPVVDERRAEDAEVRHVRCRGISYGNDSSVNACWCSMVRPRPPYSFGKQMPANPAVEQDALQRAVAHPGRVVFGRSGGGASGARSGMCSASHARARRRNASTLSGSSRVASSGTVGLRVVGEQQRGDALTVLGGSAVEVAVDGDPPQVQVQVVLPGDADAPVELGALLQQLGVRGRRGTTPPRSRSRVPRDRRPAPRALRAR